MTKDCITINSINGEELKRRYLELKKSGKRHEDIYRRGLEELEKELIKQENP